MFAHARDQQPRDAVRQEAGRQHHRKRDDPLRVEREVRQVRLFDRFEIELLPLRIELPTSGTIERTMSISWPIAMAGAIHGVLTGNDNIRFIARVYGKPFDQLRDFVEDFAQLGSFLSEPVKTYSAGMMGRLNFGLSLAVDFDCYLVDEVIAAGDHNFQLRCHEELFEKRADRALVLASHVAEFVRGYCSRALILHRGRAKVFDDLDLALDIYSAL